jgi:hypothetical protein
MVLGLGLPAFIDVRLAFVPFRMFPVIYRKFKSLPFRAVRVSQMVRFWFIYLRVQGKVFFERNQSS